MYDDDDDNWTTCHKPQNVCLRHNELNNSNGIQTHTNKKPSWISYVCEMVECEATVTWRRKIYDWLNYSCKMSSFNDSVIMSTAFKLTCGWNASILVQNKNYTHKTSKTRNYQSVFVKLTEKLISGMVYNRLSNRPIFNKSFNLVLLIRAFNTMVCWFDFQIYTSLCFQVHFSPFIRWHE